MGSYGGIIWFVVIGALFFWMMSKGGCCGGGHGGHGGEGGHDHGGKDEVSGSGESTGHVHNNIENDLEKKKSCH